jgi:hypothetical protein
MKSIITLIIFLFCVLIGYGSKAEEMAFPVVCEAGKSCFIINYPDLNRKKNEAQDYACGPAANDGDPFLRIALPNTAATTLNVYVLAVQSGRVIDVNDGVTDLVASSKKQLGKDTPNCGNGVVIDHAEGLNTGYCHLKLNSITVKKGDIVTKGQVIGLVGQSGVALWPQLGFSIKKNGFMIDPITNESPLEGCGFKPKPILALPGFFKEYQPAAIVSTGFSTGLQKEYDVAVGTATQLIQINPASQTINLWGMILGARTGDTIETTLKTPEGRVFYRKKETLTQDRDRYLINATRTRGFSYWREGVYTGEITLTRSVMLKPYIVTKKTQVLIKTSTP